MAVKPTRGSAGRGANTKAAGRPCAKTVTRPGAANPLKSKQKSIKTEPVTPAPGGKSPPKIPAPSPGPRLKRGGSGAIGSASPDAPAGWARCS